MPVFSCDGASLSNSHLNGCLLLSTGMDAERRIVLFAVGNCKWESKNSCTWFLGKCVEAHEELNQLQGALISDRDKGLNAVNLNDIMPNMEHVFCCKHIERNLRARFKGFPTSASYQFWKAVRSTSIQEFNDAMEMFPSLHNEAYTMYINGLEPSQWTSVFCLYQRYGCYTSNVSESLDNVFKEARVKTILDLLHDILSWCINKFVKRAKMSK